MCFLIPSPQFTSFLFPACRPHPHPALGFSETKGQGMEKTDLRPLGGDVWMYNNWELLRWDPTPFLRLLVGVWTQAGCASCSRSRVTISLGNAAGNGMFF